MKIYGLAGLLLLTCCGYGDVPEPQSDKGQLIVELKAYAKRGLDAQKNVYGEPKIGGNQFQKVNYSSFPNIAVWLLGNQLDNSGPAVSSRELVVGRRGPNQRLIVLPQGGKLTLTNKSQQDMCLFCQASDKGFDRDIKSGQTTVVKVESVGVHEIYCDDSEEFRVTLVVTPNTYAHQGSAGDYVYFDKLAPGTYTLCVKAARLPLYKEWVTVRAGQRTVIKSKLGVHQLTDSK